MITHIKLFEEYNLFENKKENKFISDKKSLEIKIEELGFKKGNRIIFTADHQRYNEKDGSWKSLKGKSGTVIDSGFNGILIYFDKKVNGDRIKKKKIPMGHGVEIPLNQVKI